MKDYWPAGRKYPFYGVQWHPEVNRFQWDPRYNFPHSSNAVQVSSLLAEFFVNEGNCSLILYLFMRLLVPHLYEFGWTNACVFSGRRSSHHFSEAAEESSALIYNYNPVYVENISAYEQSYFFWETQYRRALRKTKKENTCQDISDKCTVIDLITDLISLGILRDNLNNLCFIITLINYEDDYIFHSFKENKYCICMF